MTPARRRVAFGALASAGAHAPGVAPAIALAKALAGMAGAAALAAARSARAAEPASAPPWVAATPSLQAPSPPAVPPAASDPAEGDGLGQMRVKAAYLAKFGAFVTWPDRAFAQADAPLVIGVLDADVLAEELALVVLGRMAQGRLLTVRKLHAGDTATGLHMLFIGDASAPVVAAMLAATRSLPVLTVTDQLLPARGTPGTVITFVVVAGRLRFDVSMKAATAAGLAVSARLLTAAHHVEGTAP